MPGSNGARQSLAFFSTVGNNPFGTVMRLTCELAIAFCLSFGAMGFSWQQQDVTGSANANGQPPAPTTPPKVAPPEPTSNESPSVAPSNPQPATMPKPQPTSTPKKRSSAGSSSAHVKRRKRMATTPPGAPRKVVVREGGAREPAAQIAPGMTPEEATRQRQNAEQWLGSTDDQLKQLTERRTLDARQQETVEQIHNYMNGAQTALKEGDVGRASTLAQKARLLTEDLLKH
jgi:hypothetical protein